MFSLNLVSLYGANQRQLTFDEVSYKHPDLGNSDKLLASRIRIQSDIWKFPVGGSALENTRAGVRITRQTGLAQTPSVSPDEKELVYLSDSGGHSNLWVVGTDGSGAPPDHVRKGSCGKCGGACMVARRRGHRVRSRPSRRIRSLDSLAGRRGPP